MPGTPRPPKSTGAVARYQPTIQSGHAGAAGRVLRKPSTKRMTRPAKASRRYDSIRKETKVLRRRIASYLLLAFAGLVIRFVEGFLSTRPAVPAWPLWIVGWYLATAPVLFGGRGVPGAAARDATDTAFAFALPVAAAGFWVFVLWRRVLELGWGWLPELRL